MRCNSSKFLLISLLTFVVGFGIVQVWQHFVLDRVESKISVTNLIKTPKPDKKKRNTCEQFNYSEIKPNGITRIIVVKEVWNNRARCVADTIYPSAALAVKANGEVRVQVLINESGKVVSAKAISGHPLLKSSAIEAAFKSKFSPTLLGGESVRVSGVLSFNYVLPD